MTTLGERIVSKVVRGDDHDGWTGTTKDDGTPVVKEGGKTLLARVAVWQLAHGTLPDGQTVAACPATRSCLRIDHLTLTAARRTAAPVASPARRARKGGGSLTRRGDSYKLDLRTRGGRHIETIRGNAVAVEKQRAEIVADIRDGERLPDKDKRKVKLKDAVEQHLRWRVLITGTGARSVSDYRQVWRQWFGHMDEWVADDLTDEAIETVFEKMVLAGLSKSRIGTAASLWRPFARWLRDRKYTRKVLLDGFRTPGKSNAKDRRLVAERDEMALYLATAAEVTPDAAPAFALGALVGCRRGELCAFRESDIDYRHDELVVRHAIGDVFADLELVLVTPNGVKVTKTNKPRRVSLDPESMEFLRRHCEQLRKKAANDGVEIAGDPFLFASTVFCTDPIDPGWLTKQAGIVKETLGIDDKSPEVREREDEALAMRRERPSDRPYSMTGPRPQGMSYREIGEAFAKSAQWAMKACQSAERRERAKALGLNLDFNGSILGLRKFTSTELLDAGFSPRAIAEREGNSAQMILKHYADKRKSADAAMRDHMAGVRLLDALRGES